MNYKGGGLGKRNDGIVDPVNIVKMNAFSQKESDEESLQPTEIPPEPTDVHLWPRNTISHSNLSI